MRKTAVFPVAAPGVFKQKLLAWAEAHEVCAYLDSNDFKTQNPKPKTQNSKPKTQNWECLAAAGMADFVQKQAGQGAFEALQNLHDDKRDWLFGFLGYDLKNELENLRSENPDGIGLPDLYFFQPENVVGLRDGQAHVFSLHDDPEAVFQIIENQELDDRPPSTVNRQPSTVQPKIAKADYLKIIEQVRRDIALGDFYELNFCQEFFAEGAEIDPAAIFRRLNAIGRAPFSAYFRLRELHLCCASPERFLKKTGDQLASQPIKGTRRRGQTEAEDAALAHELAASAKDRSENVMIVDLVRNDLGRVCEPGTVAVPELCGIHRFETVFQMISTVVGRLRPEVHWVDALRAAFPPGSMTGAPKVMAMQRIERYEKSRRGLYSGAVGYITPEADFDFNVVIRSVLYNSIQQYVSFQVGGAIVFDSQPEAEYEECLVKAEAMLRALGLT
ncbi:MAG: aminodeoxychorismate synthase component I [Saprospiraceae bacterium]